MSRLDVNEVPDGAVSFNVKGRRVTSPIQGFGKMWQKTYQVRLPAETVSAVDLIAMWKLRFPEFWPEGNTFYGPLTGIEPGEVALLDVTLPGKMKLSTGVLVLYADEESFTLMTPQGHMFAGWITFSALEAEGHTVAQAQVLMRASDPIFELGLTLGGHGQEDRFWQRTLIRLAEHYGHRCRGGHPGGLRRQAAPVVEVAQRVAQLRDPLHDLHRRRSRAGGEAAVHPWSHECLMPAGRRSSSAPAPTGWPRRSRWRRPDVRSRCSRAPTPSAAAAARRSSRCRASCTTPARRCTRWPWPRRS